MANLLTFKQRRADLSPRTRRRAEEILNTARQIFSENGYEKTTTLDIAQRLGISEATVFTYFDSKRELCMQVVNDWYAEISEQLERELPYIQGTRAQLSYVVQKHLNILIRDGKGLCALVLTEGRHPDSEFSDLLAHLLRRYTAPLMNVLSSAQTLGEIRADMPLRFMRDMVYGSMEHVLWQCIASHHMPDLELAAKQITEMLWSAFAPPDVNLNALRQLQVELAAALRRFENTDSEAK